MVLASQNLLTNRKHLCAKDIIQKDNIIRGFAPKFLHKSVCIKAASNKFLRAWEFVL